MTARSPDKQDLHWVLGGLALVMALHVSHLALWVTIFVSLLGVWRYLIARYHWPLPRTYVLMPLTLLAAIGILFSYRGLFGRDASVELLALMLMLKLMEAKSRRDYVLLILSGYFLTITTFLFSQSMAYGAAMLAPTFALTAGLVGISHSGHQPGWQLQTRTAGMLLLQAVPMMLVLFILFPRIPGPLWGLPQDANKGMSGLSDSMEPGNISELILSGAIAFRVEFEGSVPPSHQLYWRGPVLWHFDGRVWTMASPNLPIEKESLHVSGEPVHYRMTLEPSNRRSLLLLDLPNTYPSESQVTRDHQILAQQPVRRRIRYEATSYPEYQLATEISPREIELTLQIHDFENPKTRALAQSWQEAGLGPSEIVQQALRMFREQPFVYTLQPPLLGSEPIDDFLFNTRRGFCEHYASSFAYLMRAAGVPARVVTGYQGGEFNPSGNYLIVRQSDAHAWTEVWLEGKGWVRVDPTAAVAPSRIESGIFFSVQENSLLPLLARQEYPRLRKLYLNLDAIDNAWNHWILEYNHKRQLELLSRLKGHQLSWQDLTIVMVITVSLIGLALTAYILRDQKPWMPPIQRLYARFLRKVKRHGVVRGDHEGPLDFSHRAMQAWPEQSQTIREITEIYLHYRYRNQLEPALLSRLKRLIQSL